MEMYVNQKPDRYFVLYTYQDKYAMTGKYKERMLGALLMDTLTGNVRVVDKSQFNKYGPYLSNAYVTCEGYIRGYVTLYAHWVEVSEFERAMKDINSRQEDFHGYFSRARDNQCSV